MFESDLETARRIAGCAAALGGRAYFVGGCVRDRIMGKENKDLDIEIHGLPCENVKAILDGLGDCITVGASFGVFRLKGREIDIALPRSETGTGRGGHKDFEIFVDPYIGPQKAARRRDFTINALMQDILSGEISDFFGGLEDIRAGIIRHVDDLAFAEDPLRVLRACRFAARFGFRIADETAALCRRMDLSRLSAERITGELENALLKAETPSVFFEELKKMDGLSFWFPEINALSGIRQDPAFHPEGDVWKHTMKTLDEAAKLRERAENPFWFMLSALCHDLGKSVSTREIDGSIHAYGHEETGAEAAERLLRRLTRETKLQQYVLNMVRLHMRPNMLVQQKASDKAFMRLFDLSVCPEDLLLLSEADHAGSCAGAYDAIGSVLREKLGEYHRRMALPYVKGEDLIKAGVEPSPAFSEALRYAHKLRLAGVDKKEALTQTMGFLRQIGERKE